MVYAISRNGTEPTRTIPQNAERFIKHTLTQCLAKYHHQEVILRDIITSKGKYVRYI